MHLTFKIKKKLAYNIIDQTNKCNKKKEWQIKQS